MAFEALYKLEILHSCAALLSNSSCLSSYFVCLTKLNLWLSMLSCWLWPSPVSLCLAIVFLSVLQLMLCAYKLPTWFLYGTVSVDHSGFYNVLLFAGVVSTTSHQLWCQVVTLLRSSVQCA